MDDITANLDQTFSTKNNNRDSFTRYMNKVCYHNSKKGHIAADSFLKPRGMEYKGCRGDEKRIVSDAKKLEDSGEKNEAMAVQKYALVSIGGKQPSPEYMLDSACASPIYNEKKCFKYIVGKQNDLIAKIIEVFIAEDLGQSILVQPWMEGYTILSLKMYCMGLVWCKTQYPSVRLNEIILKQKWMIEIEILVGIIATHREAIFHALKLRRHKLGVSKAGDIQELYFNSREANKSIALSHGTSK